MSENHHIFISGDIHGDHSIRKLSSHTFPEGRNLTKDDYLIIAGDFGLVWNWKGEDSEERYWLDWLSSKPWTTLFVDGNHESFERLNSYPIEQWHGGKVHKIRDDIIHLMRGQVFDICGKKIFCLGGAYSHDIEYRTPYKTWWPEEVPSKEERTEAIKNLDAHGWEVDLVVTHDGPLVASSYLNRMFGGWDRRNDEFEKWMDSEICKRLKFGTWYFGHHHIDIDAMSFESSVPDRLFRPIYHDIVKIV